MAAAAPTRLPSLRTRGIVKELVADGDRVGIVLAGPDRVAGSSKLCPRVVLWTPREHRAIRLSGSCNDWSSRGSVFGVALSGKRAAWVRSGGGNTYETSLFLRTAGQRRATQIAFASADPPAPGYFVGNARGEGPVLVFNEYARCSTEEGSTLSCPPGLADGSIFRALIWRYTGKGKSKLIASQPSGELSVLALGAGRVAVRTMTGSVEVLSATTGAVMRTYHYAPDLVRAAALDANYLVVLRDGLLDVHKLGADESVRTVPLPLAASYGPASPPPEIGGKGPPALTPKLTLEDVGSGLAVYVFDRAVHVVRLADGRDVVVARPSSGPVHAQAQATGIWIASAHRVTFMPIAQVRRRLMR
jgi:hypothetical protein